MTIIIPGKPTEFTEPIETPDIAELLMYPYFQLAHADTVRKYGSKFQNKLLDLAPLRHNRKNVTVFSQVQLIQPNTRAITSVSKDDKDRKYFEGNEWHIDGEDFRDQPGFDHLDPLETFHLFNAHTTHGTLVPKDEFVEFPEEIFGKLNRIEFAKEVKREVMRRDKAGKPPLFEKEMLENNRIYTLSNHLHSSNALKKGMEFRFTFRIRETDRDLPPTNYQMPDSGYQETANGKRENIFRNRGEVKIKYPIGIWNFHNKGDR